MTTPGGVGLDEMRGRDTKVGRAYPIPAIGEAPWGTHLCQFHLTKQDLLDILVPYFHAGLENNEACYWRTYAPLEVDDAIEAMTREMDDFEQRIDSGQMKIMSGTMWYGPAGTFEKDRVLSTVIPRVSTALADGYSGMRVTGNMAWLEDRDWDAFMDYEEGLNRVMAGRPIIGLCTYSLAKCDAAHMIDVLMRHQFALVKHAEWTLIEPSERKRATEVVERMNTALTERTAELQAALANLRGFSRWVSHDLRAPLRSITSFGTMLADSSEDVLSDRQRHMLDRIRKNADRMDRLITDILAYSMAQRTELKAGQLDMMALAREVCDGLADQAGQVRLRVGELPDAYGDAAMISQVLANLVGNAVKFTRNTPDGLVEIEATRAGEETIYLVRDNGAGFDMAEAGKLFGAFERLHSGGEFEGTGLGLAIVKEIITRHGGRVWAEGSPGSGATFFFALAGTRPGG